MSKWENLSEDERRHMEESMRALIPKMLCDGANVDEIIRAEAERIYHFLDAATEEEAAESILEGMSLPRTAEASVWLHIVSQEFMKVFARLRAELGEDWEQRLRNEPLAAMCFNLGRLLERVHSTLTGETDKFILFLEHQRRARTTGQLNALSDGQLRDRAELLTHIFWEVAKDNPTLKKSAILERMIERGDVKVSRGHEIRKLLLEYKEWPPSGWKQ